MTSYQQGSNALFQSEFLDQPGGTATDPSAISLSFLASDGSTAAGPFAYPGTITRVSVGLFEYTWAIPAGQGVGTYQAKWTATINGSQSIGYETFTVVTGSAVVPGPVLAWATTSDVNSLTGVTATTDELVQANAIVEMYTGRLYATAAAHTGTRDTEWIRRAVAYQCAWMQQQPDLYSRLDFTAIGKDRGTPVSITESALSLAPLARMALKKVSWLKSRSLHVRSPMVDGLGPLSSNPMASDNDYYAFWTPIGTGGW